MTISHSNAVLGSYTGHTQVEPHSLRLADDVRGYSTTPTAHVRDLVADGIKGNGLAVYFAIADRQVSNKGEYFRSNESLAEETGLNERTVQRWISKLRKKQYLSVWYINGGRRMRISTKVTPVTPQHDTSVTSARHQCHPYKENNIKKTLQQKPRVVSSISLSKSSRALFGEDSISRLVATYGSQKVERGLLAWDAENQDKIRNPLGWLTRAIKDEYEPRKATRVSQSFPEDIFAQDKIIREYQQQSAANVDIVNKLIDEGIAEGRIAHRIWSKKI